MENDGPMLCRLYLGPCGTWADIPMPLSHSRCLILSHGCETSESVLDVQEGWVGITTVAGPKGVWACQVQVVERMIVVLYCLGTVHEM